MPTMRGGEEGLREILTLITKKDRQLGLQRGEGGGLEIEKIGSRNKRTIP